MATSPAHTEVQELGSWTFGDGAQGWTGQNQAVVSDLARRPGTKSLQIKQTKDAEQDSAWLSPILKSRGKPVRVCFWAADNYVVQQDLSYSAAIAVVAVDDQGKPAKAQAWTQIPWDDSLKQQWWGRLTDTGLLWKYYEFSFSPPAGAFRVQFFWPKTIVRGECYLTDLRVVESDSPANANPASAISGKAESAQAKAEYTLELSTPANGNLFYADDPLRFELLLFHPAGTEIQPLSQPVIGYDVTDYQGSLVASGTSPFDHAAPREIAKNSTKLNRTRNLHQSIVLTAAAAKEVGREFFLHVSLRDGKALLGEATIPYGVVDPRPIAAEDYNKSLFVHFEGQEQAPVNTESKHELQRIRDKMGISFEHDWDYGGWKKAQPVFPGPMKIDPAPDFPKLVFCPNLDQIRGRAPNHPYGDVGAMAPAGASFDDPLRPGCKTFDIDGYVDYIVARIRAQRNRIAMVVPSGLERPIDSSTIELQRKAYAAIKKEFPDLPVGMMLYGLFGNPSDQANIFLKEKLYECADFIDDHMYSPSMDWTEWKRLQREVKAKGKNLYLISTEFSRVGGVDQAARSRAMVNSHLEAWANGMRWITYFNVKAEVDQPILREPVGGDGFQWIQRLNQPNPSPVIKAKSQPQFSHVPLLQTMTYYNLVQEFEGAEFRASFRPSDDTVVYVFARHGQTICAFHLTKPTLPRNLSLLTDVPFTCRDLFGKTERFEPTAVALVSAIENPTVITFDREVPLLYDATTAPKVLQSAGSAPVPPLLARGVDANVPLTIPGIFTNDFSATVSGFLDRSAPATSRQVPIKHNEPVTMDVPIHVGSQQAPGAGMVVTRIQDQQRLVGVLSTPVTIAETLSVQLTGLPLLPHRSPAIEVTVRNLSDVTRAGSVTLDNRYFGAALQPAEMTAPYSVPPHGESVLRFDVPAGQINLGSSYGFTATLRDNGGTVVTKTEEVAFRASLKTKTPMTIDGDLTDWKLEELTPIPFERYVTSLGKQVAGSKELAAVAYSRWDDDCLYFAVVVTDDKPAGISRVNDVGIWLNDNIMLGFYPWGWRTDEPLKDGYYREHLGPCADGVARVFRIGNVPDGQVDATGVKVAVKRTATGYVYEWAYPRNTIRPFVLEPGARFRVSLAAVNRVSKEDKWGTMDAVQLGGFNLSIDAQPTKWREFVLVGEAAK
ncbi:MAG: hypothetical protein ACOYM3_13220 [Terrimicrobiaceae bacterium]